MVDKNNKVVSNSISKKKKIAIITITIAILVIAVVLISLFVLKPYVNYSNAIKYSETGEFDKAISIFEELEGYKDSEDRITEIKYLKAKSLMDSEDYQAAYELFIELNEYKDCEKLKTDCIYQQAIVAIGAEDFRKARTLLDSITDDDKNEYRESKSLYDKCDQLEKEEQMKISYDKAKDLYDNKKYYEAAYSFNELKDEKYKNSEELFNESVYNYYISYVNDIEEKIKNDEEIVFEEDDIGAWINDLIEKSYKDINKWNNKFNNLMDEYYRIEAKLIINSDGSKNEKGSKYNTGIYELAMIAKITKAPKTIEGSSILFRVEYSGPTIMIGNPAKYSAEIVDGYAYAYIYTPHSGTYDIKIYFEGELLDSRTVSVIESE